jgi:hypothetical protein
MTLRPTQMRLSAVDGLLGPRDIHAPPQPRQPGPRPLPGAAPRPPNKDAPATRAAKQKKVDSKRRQELAPLRSRSVDRRSLPDRRQQAFDTPGQTLEVSYILQSTTRRPHSTHSSMGPNMKVLVTYMAHLVREPIPWWFSDAVNAAQLLTVTGRTLFAGWVPSSTYGVDPENGTGVAVSCSA